MLTNKEGNDVGQFLYTPFGEMWVEQASTVDISHITRFFTNQQYDKESGLYYYNARYYDPHLGSFISADPAMDGFNHYAYANSNPIKYTDPTGLSVVTDYSDPSRCPVTNYSDYSNPSSAPTHSALQDTSSITSYTPPSLPVYADYTNPSGPPVQAPRYADYSDPSKAPTHPSVPYEPSYAPGMMSPIDTSITHKLPLKGDGFDDYAFAYRGKDRADLYKYGRKEAIDFLTDLAIKFKEKYSDKTLYIGDISKKGGGATPGHNGYHHNGFNFDIKFITTDGKLHGGNYNGNGSFYDQNATKDLIDMMINNDSLTVEVKYILFNDPVIDSQYGKVSSLSGHSNHIDVMLKLK